MGNLPFTIRIQKNTGKKIVKIITTKFRKFCKTKTEYQILNMSLERLYNNRKF